MSDCPHCDDWWYDSSAACIYVRRLGDIYPVVWDGERLRRAWGEEAHNGRKEATALHICSAHPMDPAVLLLGPVESYAPLGSWLGSILGRPLGAHGAPTQ